MKPGALLFSLLLILALPARSDPEAGVSFGLFYSSLSPHGEWISIGAGHYAWRPVGVAAGWRPYHDGRWLWTDEGWYWDSDEPYAWAVYHYGRWYYDDYYGWIWTPGYDWAPAWVEWRDGGDYVGWAPLGPYAMFSVDVGLYYGRPWVTPYHYWSFVDCGHITHRDVGRYVYRPEETPRFIGRSRSAGSVRFDGERVVSRGPDRGYIERRAGVRIEQVPLVDAPDRASARATPDGGRERLSVYRPRIDPRAAEGGAERPARVREADRLPSLDARDLETRPGARDRGIRWMFPRDAERADPGTLKPRGMDQRPVAPSGRQLLPRVPERGGAAGSAEPRRERTAPGWWGQDRQGSERAVPRREEGQLREQSSVRPAERSPRQVPAQRPQQAPRGGDRR